MPRTSMIQMIDTIQYVAVQLSFAGQSFTTNELQTRAEIHLGVRPGDTLVLSALDDGYELVDGKWQAR